MSNAVLTSLMSQHRSYVLIAIFRVTGISIHVLEQNDDIPNAFEVEGEVSQRMLKVLAG